MRCGANKILARDHESHTKYHILLIIIHLGTFSQFRLQELHGEGFFCFLFRFRFWKPVGTYSVISLIGADFGSYFLEM